MFEFPFSLGPFFTSLTPITALSALRRLRSAWSATFLPARFFISSNNTSYASCFILSSSHTPTRTLASSLTAFSLASSPASPAPPSTARSCSCRFTTSQKSTAVSELSYAVLATVFAPSASALFFTAATEEFWHFESHASPVLLCLLTLCLATPSAGSFPGSVFS